MVSSTGPLTLWLLCGPQQGMGQESRGQGLQVGVPLLSAMGFPFVAVLQVCLGGPFNMAVCLRRKHLCFPVTIILRKSQCPIVTGNSPLGLWLSLSSATLLQIVTLLN